jgi:hypothetical protein
MIENKRLPLSHWLERLSLSPRGHLRMRMVAINVQRPITLKLLNEYQDELTPELYQALTDHLKKMDIREITCAKEDALKEIKLSDMKVKDQIKLKKEILGEYQVTLKSMQVDQAISTDSTLEILQDVEDRQMTPYQSKFKNDSRVIRPRPGEVVEKKLPLVSLNDCTFLTYGASSLITASPGNGKSSVCLAICSKVINRDCDGLGFEIPDNSIEKVLYFDGELDKFQASENFKKMIARANVSASEIDEKFRYIGTAMVDNVMERRAMIEEEIREFKPQIVIIDGSADLVNDPNNGEECIKLKTYIRHLTSRYKIGIILTIHPNPGSDRPQGHLGTKMQQEVGSSIILKRTFDGGSISSDFAMGKRRHSPNKHLKGNFIYDKDKEDLFSGDPNLLVGRPKKMDLCELDENEIRKMQVFLRYSLTYDKHMHELEKYCKLKHPGYAMGRPAITRFHKDLIGREIILTQKIESKVEYYFSDPNQGSIEFKKE